MPKLVLNDLTELYLYKDKVLPSSDWITVGQKMIDSFAAATLDYQWIHTDREKAKVHSPYKDTVAHGFMSVSLISKFLEDVLVVKSVDLGVNYGLDKVRFPSPVVVGSKLRMHTKILKVEPYGPNGAKVTWDCKVEIHGVDKPACVAQLISVLFQQN